MQGIGLADSIGKDAWMLKPGWDATLKALGQRGDILKALAAKNRDLKADQVLRQFEPGASGGELLGSVVTSFRR